MTMLEFPMPDCLVWRESNNFRIFEENLVRAVGMDHRVGPKQTIAIRLYVEGGVDLSRDRACTQHLYVQ